MRTLVVVGLLVTLILFSGCIHGAQTAQSCDSSIEDLPKVIEENQGRSIDVAQVVDGDTIELENGEKIRLIGVNTPEKGRKYSENATDLTKSLVKNGISITGDEESKDRYDRLLRYVFTEDKFVNAELIREGLATTFPVEPNTRYDLLLSCLEKEAKENKIGIWSSSALDAYDIEMDVQYNAKGDDRENLNGEFVILFNEGSTTIDLEDWSIKDDATHEYVFKAVELAAEGSVTLYSGSGSDIKTEVYWNSKTPIWNNNGDTAYLFNKEGDLVILLSFP